MNALVVVSRGIRTVKLLQQNPPVLNWRCWLMQVVLYIGRKATVVAAVVLLVVEVLLNCVILSIICFICITNMLR